MFPTFKVIISSFVFVESFVQNVHRILWYYPWKLGHACSYLCLPEKSLLKTQWFLKPTELMASFPIWNGNEKTLVCSFSERKAWLWPESQWCLSKDISKVSDMCDIALCYSPYSVHCSTPKGLLSEEFIWLKLRFFKFKFN